MMFARWIVWTQTILFGILWQFEVIYVHPALLGGLCILSLGNVIQQLGYPYQVRANEIGLLVQASSWIFFAYCFWDLGWLTTGRSPRTGREFLLGLACTVKTTRHLSPGGHIVWNARTSGRWCKSANQQLTSISWRMERYRKRIEKDRCFTPCMYKLPSSGADWQGSISSAPPDKLPDALHCPNGYYFGRCPEHDRYQPHKKRITFQQGENVILIAPA